MIADRHGLRHHRHARRGADPIHAGIVDQIEAVINGLAGQNVGADHPEIHRRGIEGQAVEGIQIKGQCLVAEFRAEEVACPHQRADRAVAPIAAIPQIVAQGSADLTGLVVAAERRSRGYAHHMRDDDIVFEKGIQHAHREKPAHRAAFEDESEMIGHDLPSSRFLW